MKSKNHLPVKLNETMMMVEAGEKLQKHLHLPSATSIVNYIEFIGYDENGNLVEYTESYSRPDKLEVRLSQMISKFTLILPFSICMHHKQNKIEYTQNNLLSGAGKIDHLKPLRINHF